MTLKMMQSNTTGHQEYNIMSKNKTFERLPAFLANVSNYYNKQVFDN